MDSRIQQWLVASASRLAGLTFLCVMWHETMIMTAAGHTGGTRALKHAPSLLYEPPFITLPGMLTCGSRKRIGECG